MKIKSITLASKDISKLPKIEGLPVLVNLFDAKTGHNGIPNSESIDYFGVTVFMTPDEFLKLAAPSPDINPEFYAKKIQAGIPLGYPYLDVENKESSLNVFGHEGRNRVSAIKSIYGGSAVLVPVHVFVQYHRNRNIDPKIIDLPFKSEIGNTKIKFNSNRLDHKSECLNLGKIKAITIARPLSFHTDLMNRPQISPENVERNENMDDLQVVEKYKQDKIKVYNNPQLSIRSTRLMPRVN